MNGRQFQFEWDEAKAAANFLKHRVSFELACTVFGDPRLLTIADLEHSQSEDRWFSVGSSSNGSVLSVVYIWLEGGEAVTIRIISARRATRREVRQYQESP